MRLVHTADWHLGFRQFQRITKGGTNAREADVARAFKGAVDQIVTLAPDLIVVAGDVFHSPRPPNNALVHAHRQLVRLRAELPQAVIVMCAGNHDAGRAADTGHILALFEALGVHVAVHGALRLTLPELGLSVLAVPDVAGCRPLLEPDPSARYNVLVLHGEVEYVAPGATPAWDYVALGHYHVHREVAPRTFYAGALDYSSSNVWGELAEERARGVPGKGFVLADLEAGTQVFHPIGPTRAFLDLPEIDAEGMTPADVDAAIAALVCVADGCIDDKVVRLRVRNIPRSVSRALDVKALRTYRSRALNFQLVLDKPVEIVAGGKTRPSRRHMSLKDIVRDCLEKRELPADIDRARFNEIALKYLDEATERDTPVEEQHADVSA